MRNRVLTYIAFLLIFWLPLSLLLRFSELQGSQALIAASVGVLPLLILFVPLFESLVSRISGFKLPFLEVALKSSLESGGERRATQISVALEPGHPLAYGKSTLSEFMRVIVDQAASPFTKVVFSVDLKDGERIWLPLLYFQLNFLLGFVDLRAVLFLDTRAGEVENRVLGTTTPRGALQGMDAMIDGRLGDAWDFSVERPPEGGDIGLAELASTQWSHYLERLRSNPNQQIDGLRLNGALFRGVFGPILERNVVRVPLTSAEYPRLLNLFRPVSDRESRPNHLILVQNDDVLTVRTVDNVAREFASDLVSAVMRTSAEGGIQ